MTEFILVLGSKPDIIVSELPGVVMPHSSNLRGAAVPMALSDSLHVGVYVVAKGKESGSLMLCNNGESSLDPSCGLQVQGEDLGQAGGGFPGFSHTRCDHDVLSAVTNVPFLAGSAVPCRLECDSRSCLYSGEHSKKSTHVCDVFGSDHPFVSNGDASDASQKQIQHEQTMALQGKTFHPGKSLTCGQILSYSTLQPLGDIHHCPSDFSLMRHLPEHKPHLLDMPPASSTLQLYSPSPDPVLSASSPTPFLTPEMGQKGKVFSGTMTGSSLSPGSLCKSNSFFSCSSGLSFSSNCLGNGSPSNHAENGDIRTSNITNGIILHPACLNGHLAGSIPRPDKLELDNNHPVHAGLSSSLMVSGLLHPQLSHVKPNATNCDPGHSTMIHASYASLDDSVSGSADGRDLRSSIDWLEQDRKARKGNNHHHHYHKSNNPQSRSHLKVNFDHPPRVAEKGTTKEKSNETTAFLHKISASTISFRQKIKGYRLKKRTESVNVS